VKFQSNKENIDKNIIQQCPISKHSKRKMPILKKKLWMKKENENNTNVLPNVLPKVIKSKHPIKFESKINKILKETKKNNKNLEFNYQFDQYFHR